MGPRDMPANLPSDCGWETRRGKIYSRTRRFNSQTLRAARSNRRVRSRRPTGTGAGGSSWEVFFVFVEADLRRVLTLRFEPEDFFFDFDLPAVASGLAICWTDGFSSYRAMTWPKPERQLTRRQVNRRHHATGASAS